MRVGDARQPIGEQLRRGEQVAQIVVDLGDRKAEGGQPVLLRQHRSQIELHRCQLALGGADLVLPPRRHDDARRTLGRLMERRHVGGEPPQRPHEHVVQRKENQRRRDP